MSLNKTVILGAGLSGLSASYHIGHDKCVLYEKNNYHGGHIHSYKKNGFTWDEGPHVSFTKNNYVKDLFGKSVNGKLLHHKVKTANYFYGKWVPHPAQSNLYAIPEQLRKKVLEDFLSSRQSGVKEPRDYREWLLTAFGKTFYENFPKGYTKKYWAVDPESLSTDWIGKRVYYPDVEEVKNSYNGPLERETHYITEIRYPQSGGYVSFANALTEGSNIEFNKRLVYISFHEKKIKFDDGSTINYGRLVNTLPLPELIKMSDAPDRVKDAAASLNCTSLLLVNITADHRATRAEKWIYVYDHNKYATRLYFTEGLSPNNGIEGHTGIQVEVYFSKAKKKTESDEIIAQKVADELVEMGLIKTHQNIKSVHTKWVPWANIIFDHQRRKNQNIILDWLEQFGLTREKDDLEPMTNWEEKEQENIEFGKIILAGRFGQWKYFWTDDCVLRGRLLSKRCK